MRSHRPFFDRSESKYTDISPNFDWKGNFGFPYGLVLRYTLTEFVECINKSGYSHLSMCVHLNGSTASVYLKIRYCFSICLQNSTAQGKKERRTNETKSVRYLINRCLRNYFQSASQLTNEIDIFLPMFSFER